MGDDCHGYFEAPIHKIVDGCSEGAEFLIQLVLKFLDDLSKVFLRDERVGVGGVTHGSYFTIALSVSMDKADCHFIGIYACGIFSMWNEVYTAAKHVSEFRKSFHINRDVEALYMAPTLLFINVLSGLKYMAKYQFIQAL